MKKNIISISLVTLICILASGCHPKHNRQTEYPGDYSDGSKGVTRFGSVIKLIPEKYDLYRELHANPWPGVDSLLRVYHIRNYSIYYRDGLLFSYMEYTGENWDLDMASMSKEPILREWWKLTDPCKEPVESSAEGKWLAPMEELYHLD